MISLALSQKKALGIGFIMSTLILLVGFIPMLLIFTSNEYEFKPTTTSTITTTTYRPPSKLPYDFSKLDEDEKLRINCFLEEESRFEQLTKYQCEQVRSCIYKPSLYERVPDCFFDRFKLGYKKMKEDHTNPDSDIYYIQRYGRTKAPYLGEIKNLKVTVTYLDNGFVNVKVKP